MLDGLSHAGAPDLFFLNTSETQFVTQSSSLRLSFKLNILVIFAKFAFDGSNISVMPRAFRGSFRSVCATAVNLAGKEKIRENHYTINDAN